MRHSSPLHAAFRDLSHQPSSTYGRDTVQIEAVRGSHQGIYV